MARFEYHKKHEAVAYAVDADTKDQADWLLYRHLLIMLEDKQAAECYMKTLSCDAQTRPSVRFMRSSPLQGLISGMISRFDSREEEQGKNQTPRHVPRRSATLSLEATLAITRNRQISCYLPNMPRPFIVPPGDWVSNISRVMPDDMVMAFTASGKAYWTPALNLSVTAACSSHISASELLRIPRKETICAILALDAKAGSDQHLVLCTNRGHVLTLPVMVYGEPPRKGWIRTIHLDEGEELSHVASTDGKHEILLTTRQGMAIRFRQADIPPYVNGPSAGIDLQEGDQIAGMATQPADGFSSVVTVCRSGLARRAAFGAYPLAAIGGKGAPAMLLGKDDGVVASLGAAERAQFVATRRDDPIAFLENDPISFLASDLRLTKRATRGARPKGIPLDAGLVDVFPIVKRYEQ